MSIKYKKVSRIGRKDGNSGYNQGMYGKNQ